jgi:hypothetical protein
MRLPYNLGRDAALRRPRSAQRADPTKKARDEKLFAFEYEYSSNSRQMAYTRKAIRWALTFVACAIVLPLFAGQPREISGTLIRLKTRTPIVGQKLVLDRAAGNYDKIPFAMIIFGTPQPGTIASSITDKRGRFRFVTTKDRGRLLTIYFADRAPLDFHSTVNYAIGDLRDSLHPEKPFVSFDAHIMHNPRGGFMSVR